jgi:hypothetical protein
VDTAIQSLYRDMEYSKTLIKRRVAGHADDKAEDSEESWTFIGDEGDPELTRRIAEWEPMANIGTPGGQSVASLPKSLPKRKPSVQAKARTAHPLS